MGSFSIALTGLKAQSAALNTVGNNLANLNTTSYKEQTAQFADLFYRQLGTSGSGSMLQQGLGVRVQGTVSNFTEGSLSTTNNSTDMAIQGNGFFVVSNNGSQQLTRAGNFLVTNRGQLETQDGATVQGYQTGGGVLAPGASLTALTLPLGQTLAAQPTSKFSLTSNLSSTTATGSNFTTGMTVYDSLGEGHVMTATFTKTANNQWSYSLNLPAGDATGTPVNNTGTLTFDSAGKLVSPTGSVAGISFPGLTDGAADVSLNWSLTDTAGNGTLSQSSASSATAATTQNGYTSGSYQSFSVDSTGTVIAQYSNGQNQTVGQLAIANVANLNGLVRTGGNAYTTTLASGDPAVGAAGTGGRGSIANGELETSNVDIATEFANLIVAQRGFEANSKTITAFDTETQATINMIR